MWIIDCAHCGKALTVDRFEPWFLRWLGGLRSAGSIPTAARQVRERTDMGWVAAAELLAHACPMAATCHACGMRLTTSGACVCPACRAVNLAWVVEAEQGVAADRGLQPS
ncbi:hypothetical protein [Zavarzinella formosa]|uniref:hypothetical protein n=1 Tax=Zavarzinella formosa TaxID=360055 RepID=UPI00037A1943|nr:hypothetical protein [Zavarzinella formosa]